MSTLNSLRLLESYLEDLEDLVEESNRAATLGVEGDSNDYLFKNLSKIKKFLERNDDGENYDELVERYEEVLNKVSNVDISDFKYKRNIPVKEEHTLKKSVRFNETIDFQDEEPINSTFEPFKDDVNEEDETLRNELFADLPPQDNEETDLTNTSNKGIFIQHQQQLLQQDEHLGLLSQSVKRQHGLSLEINEELQDQNIMLDDLENQLDNNDKKLQSGHKRLEYFSKKAKENGQWLTIIALIIILVLLLIILK